MTSNKELIQQLKQYAEAFIPLLSLQRGKHTAADVAKHAATNKRRGWTTGAVFGCGFTDNFGNVYDTDKLAKYGLTDEAINDLSGELLTIDSGEFSAEFPRGKVFEILAKFEKIEGTPRGELCTFASQGDTEGEEVANFAFTMPKNIATIASFIDKDDFRPVVKQILISHDHGKAIATDCNDMIIAPATITATTTAPQIDITLPPKVAKAYSGKECQIRVTTGEVDSELLATITASDGQSDIFTMPRAKYPAWERVIPKVDKRAYFCFTAESAKQLQQLPKLNKDAHGAKVVLKSYSTTATIEVRDRWSDECQNYTLQLQQAPQIDMTANISMRVLKRLKKWGGGVWYCGNMLIFDTAEVDMVISMQFAPGECNGLECKHDAEGRVALLSGEPSTTTTTSTTPATQATPTKGEGDKHDKPQPQPQPTPTQPTTGEGKPRQKQQRPRRPHRRVYSHRATSSGATYGATLATARGSP